MNMRRTQFLLPSDHEISLEKPRTLYNERYTDSILFAGSDPSDCKLLVYLFRKSTIIQTNVYFQSSSGTEYYKSDTNLRETNDWCTISAKLECCEPMNTWRIAYNGAIRKNGSEEVYHLKMNLLWQPISSPVYFDRNRRLTFLTHKQLLVKNEAVFKLHKGFEQWGKLHGTIQLNAHEPTEVNMSGLKKRFWSSGTKDFFTIILFSDILLSNFTTSMNSRTGHVRTLRKHEIIAECDLKYSSKVPARISFQFLVNNHQYKIDASVHHPSLANFTNAQIYRIQNDFIDNGETKLMEGFLLSFRKLTRNASIYIPRIFPPPITNNEYVIELNDTLCWSPELVGREASYLSKIKYYFANISNDKSLNSVIRLPRSILLTSRAMDLYLQSKDNGSLRDRMEMLKRGIYEISSSTVSFSKTSLQEEWENSVISKELFDILLWKIDPHKRYAVRSSAICDNISELNVGDLQHGCFNVEGILSITHAIRMCWACAYSTEALNYRRNNGIPLIIEMGIIIQEMVDIDLYGNLFTCQPDSSDPRVVTIDINSCSANEEILALENPVVINKQDMKIQSVVCLHNDPSTDSSSDNDDFQRELVFRTRKIRQTNRKISICKQFVKLAEISLKFENIFSQIINIEWGLIDDKIYVFQCRPVRSSFTWSDFEICHELDSGFTEFDATTFHNYGETSCGVTSPLSITFVSKIMEEASKSNRKQVKSTYHKRRLAVTQFHTGIDVFNGVFVHVFPRIPFFLRLLEMVMRGQVIITEELNKLAQKRNGISNFWSISCMVAHIFKLSMQYHRYSSKAERLAREFRIDSKKNSCVESLFDIIIEKAELFLKIVDYHFKVSNVSYLLKCVTLWFMTVGEENNLQKHLISLSLKLEGVKTMSTELPTLLKEIASLIEMYDKEKAYLNMSRTEKLQFYESYPEIQSRIQYLIRTFGFRCMKEMDLMSETWSMNFTPVLENIDTLIARKDELGCATTTQPTNLVTSRRYSKIVNYLISRTKVVLVHRERTEKSLLLALHQFRLAFLQLGNLLTQDLRLPNANLVFYFTMFELKQIIDDDSVGIILHKGYRRFQLWNQLESLHFNDVIIGLPHPRKTELSYPSVCVLKGIAVSYHCTIGKAYVLVGKKDVKKVNPRDIIVTRNIDACWSLHFPVIAGVVTEYGGLLSRGAIAARECGLPCIVGVKNVTSYIETGDIISINGVEGIVSKLL